MTGLLNSATINGSNSNPPDNAGRALANAFPAQSGSSVPVLHQPGSIQGLHNLHGSFSMSNMPGPYASRSSASLVGLQNGVQQATGNASNGRYAINNLPNALSQLSLGNSQGHSGFTSTGGHGALPNTTNAGRMANSIGGLVGGANTSRGAGTTSLANIHGLASRLNLSAPQVPSMLGNSYSGGGMPISQNQYQAGNNQFSFMALLNDSNGHDRASFDVSDFPQLSGQPHSAGGSQGQLGLMQKHSFAYGPQNQEFSIQNENFPALPGYRGGLSAGGGAEYNINSHQKEQIHDNMANLIQSQSIGRSSGFAFGGSYSSHHPQQQHRASAINGTAVTYLSSGNQGLHFNGAEQYQQFQQSQPRFINGVRDDEMKPTHGSQIVPDRYGMLGLLSIIKLVNPSFTSLGLGLDLTTLGLNLSSSEALHKKFASPWSNEPAKGEPEYTVPQCYNAKRTSPLKQSCYARLKHETLFYIFYSMPKDEAQLFASNELYNRGWFYHKEHRLWFIKAKNVEPPAKTNTHERGCYYYFDPNNWQTTKKDNFVLQYEMVEKRPVLTQQQQ